MCTEDESDCFGRLLQVNKKCGDVYQLLRSQPDACWQGYAIITFATKVIRQYQLIQVTGMKGMACLESQQTALFMAVYVQGCVCSWLCISAFFSAFQNPPNQAIMESNQSDLRKRVAQRRLRVATGPKQVANGVENGQTQLFYAFLRSQVRIEPQTGLKKSEVNRLND